MPACKCLNIEVKVEVGTRSHIDAQHASQPERVLQIDGDVHTKLLYSSIIGLDTFL